MADIVSAFVIGAVAGGLATLKMVNWQLDRIGWYPYHDESEVDGLVKKHFPEVIARENVAPEDDSVYYPVP